VGVGHICLGEDVGVRNLILALYFEQFSEAAFAKVIVLLAWWLQAVQIPDAYRRYYWMTALNTFSLADSCRAHTFH